MRSFLFGVAAFAFAAPAAAQTDLATKFGARESASSVSLSPDGKHIAFLQPVKGKGTALFVADADSSAAPKQVTYSDAAPWQMIWCDWASNARLVCKAYGISNDAGLLLGFTRLLAINMDGTNVKSLGQRQSSRSLGINQFDGDLVGWTADDSGAVLMSRNYVPENTIGTRLAKTANGLGVDRVDTLTLKATREETPKGDAAGYIADTGGNIRIMAMEERADDGVLRGITRYYYRIPGERDWRPFSEDSEAKPGMRPVAVDATRNVAYAFGKKDGRNVVYRVSLDGNSTVELVLASDKVDVNDLLTLGRTGRVIGADIVTDKRESVLFDPEYKALVTKLGKALPGLPLVHLVGASRDESKLLLYAGSDTDPGRYYIYEKSSRRLNEIMLVRPELEGMTLAKVQPVAYPAKDGTNIPAYLTLPPGGSGKGLPAIVIPHGGPGARDEWGFDWLAQYFAAQGFAVLQPNFRGSTGYGDDWYVNNGFKSWRTAIGDVNDAGRWLVSQGVADPQKLAIFGWSYGGYAALQTSVLDPDLFKAIVAVAPVTDLRMMIDQAQRYTNSALVERFVGSGEHLTSGSPRKQAALIKAPVLMFTGDLDLNVNAAQARAMDAALKEAGKTSELILYPGLEHSLIDSTVRADLLRKSSDFFRKTLKLK